jgi:hypothetical protein
MACSISRSLINDEQALQIRSYLCLTPKVIQNKYNRNAVTDPIIFYQYIDQTIHLPMSFAQKLLSINNDNNKFAKTGLTFTGKLRDYQIDVEEEAWKQMETYRSTTLSLYPGFGKTILGAKLASRTQLLTVILVTNTILLGQWKKTFEDNTNAKVWIVGENHPPEKCNVIICMDTRYKQISSEIRNMVGILIIDEAHLFCTPTRVGALLAFHPKYVIIESASLERDDELESMIYAIAGTHNILRLSEKPFTVYKVITNIKPERKKNKIGGVDFLKLQQATLFDERRIEIILNMIKINLNFKILILTSLVDHALLLHNKLDALKISCDYLCGSKKGYSDSNVLIGTMSKIGTGFDPATSCPNYKGSPFDLLFLVSSIKKESMLVQNVGRCFRADFPTVMHFVDDDDIYKNHWYRAKKWYTKRNGTVIEYKCPDQPKIEELAAEEWAKTKMQELKGRKLKLNIIS